MVIVRAPWSATAPSPEPLTSLELLLPMLNGSDFPLDFKFRDFPYRGNFDLLGSFIAAGEWVTGEQKEWSRE